MNKISEMNPYFSVIIPVYDVEQFLEQCVESVLNQSCTDYEIILVNDGSTDASGAICDRYCSECDKIHVIHKKNGGQSSARNAGLEVAVGKYVLFLDSDDFYADVEILHKLKQLTDEREYDFVMFKAAKYYTDSNVVDYYGDYNSCVFENDKSEIFRYMVEENKQLATPCNKAIRRELLSNRQIYFPLDTISEDVPWIVKLFEETQSIGAINSLAYMYRQKREGSISSGMNRKKIGQLFDIVKNLAHDYKKRTDDFGKAVMSFVALEYAMVLYLTTLSSEPIDTREMKEYRWLLKYACDKKTSLVKWACRLLGFQNTLRLLRYRKRT